LKYVEDNALACKHCIKEEENGREREKRVGGDSFSSLAGGLYIESLPCGHCGLRMTDWKAGTIKRGG